MALRFRLPLKILRRSLLWFGQHPETKFTRIGLWFIPKSFLANQIRSLFPKYSKISDNDSLIQEINNKLLTDTELQPLRQAEVVSEKVSEIQPEEVHPVESLSDNKPALNQEQSNIKSTAINNLSETKLDTKDKAEKAVENQTNTSKSNPGLIQTLTFKLKPISQKIISFAGPKTKSLISKGSIVGSKAIGRSGQVLLKGGSKALLGLGIKGLGIASGVFTGGLSTILTLVIGTKTGRKAVKWTVKWGTILSISIPIVLIVIIMPRIMETTSLLLPTEIAEGAPPPPINQNTLLYTIPFKDSKIVVSDKEKTLALASRPKARVDHWQIIVDQSIKHGWNPAFVLTLWLEESGGEGASQFDDPLGCAPQQPPHDDINASLNCLFKAYDTYTNSQFNEFMCRYSGNGAAPCTFTNNSDFPINIKKVYEELVPTGKSGSIITIPTPTPTITTAPPSYLASCPIQGGIISYPSYSKGGHCSGNYGFDCPCKPISLGRRANAIDIPTNGKDVILPTIEGKSVRWQLLIKGYPIDSGEGGGLGYLFQATLENNTWFLDLVHMQQIDLNAGGFYESGTIVGKAAINKNSSGIITDDHVHISIGKNITDPVILSNSQPFVCSSGWLPADSLCQ